MTKLLRHTVFYIFTFFTESNLFKALYLSLTFSVQHHKKLKFHTYFLIDGRSTYLWCYSYTWTNSIIFMYNMDSIIFFNKNTLFTICIRTKNNTKLWWSNSSTTLYVNKTNRKRTIVRQNSICSQWQWHKDTIRYINHCSQFDTRLQTENCSTVGENFGSSTHAQICPTPLHSTCSSVYILQIKCSPNNLYVSLYEFMCMFVSVYVFHISLFS